MRMLIVAAAVAAAVQLFGAAHVATPPPPLNTATAKALFAEGEAICGRDAGKLWKHSLCGPMMVVDPDAGLMVTSEADKGGALKPQDGVFVGKLPADMLVANTATEWAGTRWTQLIWPFVPTEPAARDVMLAHELFHRIQPELPIARFNDGDNGHMDTLEGRYLLQLEWRALARAVAADTSAARRAAVADALLFRAERYRRFPTAASDEKGLEFNEGVAEYTGVRLGLSTPAERSAFAIRDLTSHTRDATFVRSFAYATGPAYGLLLDEADPSWRSELKSGTPTFSLLRTALRLPVPVADQTAVSARAKIYDEGGLRNFEVVREAGRQQRLAAYRKALLEDSVMSLPLKNSNRQFNPSNLVAFDDVGTVYPTLRLTDRWGILEVNAASGGALVSKDGAHATVSLRGADASGLKGVGWTLILNPGCSVQPGSRSRDMTVACAGGD